MIIYDDIIYKHVCDYPSNPPALRVTDGRILWGQESPHWTMERCCRPETKILTIHPSPLLHTQFTHLTSHVSRNSDSNREGDLFSAYLSFHSTLSFLCLPRLLEAKGLFVIHTLKSFDAASKTSGKCTNTLLLPCWLL